MEKLTVEAINKAVGGTLLCGDKDTAVTSVSTDNRELMPNSLFVPICGENVDAHRFIASALEGNAVLSFTQRKELCNNNKAWILVDNTKKALQKLASYYRKTLGTTIIGVTGSVGKTSTKEMIYSVLSQKINVFKTPGNKNSQIGVPLSVLSIEKSHEVAVIEMGMSMPGEMKRLVDIVRPDYSVMTNIGLSHIENLKTQENIFKEKWHINDYIKLPDRIYLNANDELLGSFSQKSNNAFKAFGFSSGFDIYADNITHTDTSTSFTIHYKDICFQSKLNVVGEHNVLNALVATALGFEFGLSADEITQGLSMYKAPSMRQQIHKLKGANITVIDDSYNASPDSMIGALKLLKDISGKHRKIAVLSDMLELGDFSTKAHSSVGACVAKNNIDVLVTVGQQALKIAKTAKKEGSVICFSFSDNDTAFSKLSDIIEDGDFILVKGSRGMRGDEIVAKLIDKYRL